MVAWNYLRTDLRAFSRLAHFTIPAGPESALVRHLHADSPHIQTTVDAQMLAFVLCWRVACWPRSTNLIVTPTLAISKRLFTIAHTMMSNAHDDLRERIVFFPHMDGLSCAQSEILGGVHCPSGTLGLDFSESRDPLTFIIPDFDTIPADT